MRKYLFSLLTAISAFIVGVAITALIPNPALRSSARIVPSMELRSSCEAKLASQLIALERLEKITDHRGFLDDLFGRWLHREVFNYQSRPGYAEDSLVLPLEGNHKYEIVLRELDPAEIATRNSYRRKTQQPLLQPGQCYLRVAVYLDNWKCPNWGGEIDANHARLISFSGSGP
jgi:hypothetical protein